MMSGLFRKVRPLTLLLLSVACLKTPSEPSLWRDITPIGDILKDPKAWNGKEVNLLAYYRWFDLFGEAGVGPPVTRSDVSFADVTGAIYATHWETPGLSARDTDRLFLLRAEVKLNPAGQPYIEVKESREVEGLPKNVILRVKLKGGIAGFSQEILVAHDGSALHLDRKLNEHSRFKVEEKDLREILGQVRPLLGQELGTTVPDGFVYTLYAWDGDKVRTVILHAETAPRELEGVLQVLSKWFFKQTLGG